MTEPDTRICPFCAETIRRAARLCPHCRTLQGRWSAYLGVALALMTLTFLVVVAGGAFVAYRLFNPGKAFAPYRDQFSITTSSRQFSTNERGRYVTTVGTVRNNSDYAWKEVQLEVRYFDQQGKLIDVGNQIISAVEPHSESAFRVRTLADQPESRYENHKVYVRTGKDINRWP